MPVRFSELESISKGEMVRLSLDLAVNELAYDTRQLPIQSGTVFFAIEGTQHDGHAYVADAYRSGIRLFVVEKEVHLPIGSSILKVDHSIDALQSIASSHRAGFDYPVIGVTGSNGKTIVKEWLAQLLHDQFDIIKSPKSFNSQIGVPLSVWAMDTCHNLGIFEAGISEVGEMGRLQPVIRPTIGIFTNIGEVHSAGFENIQHKANEKALLFAQAQRIIYCEDHEMVSHALRRLASNRELLIGWKIIKQEGKKVTISVRGNSLVFLLKFANQASIENALHCAVTMVVLGFDQDFIQIRLNRLSTIKMRLEIKQAINRSYLIDDTYNNDLYGLEVAVEMLSHQKQRTKKSVILSDLYHTGRSAASLYTHVNAILQKHKIHRLIGIGTEIGAAQHQFHIPATFYDSTQDFLNDAVRLHEEIVLVKGARNFEFETIVRRYELKSHDTVLEVNLECLIHNLNVYRNKLSEQVKTMVMVKALAYGSGILEIANWLQFHKVDYLGVAYIDEAVLLRKNGIYLPIMILNVSPTSFGVLKTYNLEPEIYSLEQLMAFLDFFDDEDNMPDIHLKLETGMNRLGFSESHLQRLIGLLKCYKQLRVKSIFSHLSSSDDLRHKDFTLGQISKFESMSQAIMDHLWYPPMRHLANTSGIVHFPQAHFDMIRLGIGLHGYDPTHSITESLKTVSQLKGILSQIKTISAGESIGYGRSEFAQYDMQLAIVPIGYADGYFRAFGNGVGYMQVRGKLVPIVGNICMDMCMIDVTGIEAKRGDEVIIFGVQPTISQLAKWMNTIPYEILTNVSQRVKRVFLSE